MKKKEIPNWDLVVKLLNDNEVEIHIERGKYESLLYLTRKDMPEHRFNISFYVIEDNETVKEPINRMSLYNFRNFYDQLNGIIAKIKDTDVWYEKLIKEYQKKEA